MTQLSSNRADVPGASSIEAGVLVSTNPATGAEVARFPVSSAADVTSAVARGRVAAAWWARLPWQERRSRLLRFRSLLARRIHELAAVMTEEGGKPSMDSVLEVMVTIDHIAWAAKHSHKVLGSRRVSGSLLQPEYSGRLEYQPYGVIGVIGPWNYPVFTPMGSIAYALAAGNAVVFKPSEYTPAVGQWFVNAFAEIVPEQPVLQIVHGMGDVGAALCRAGIDKLAFTGSTATGKKVMAACAESLTPVLVECGGKDAMIIDADADIEAAADAALWGAMTNAGQSCVGIERVYAHAKVYDLFLAKLVAKAEKLTVGTDPGSDIGPITMPGQRDIIKRHIDDALASGGRAVLGGPDSARGSFVKPTILVDVPETSAAVCEETFGPTITVAKVASMDEAITLANATAYGLAGSVFSKRNGARIARELRSGMVSINSTFAFAVLPSLPFGGVGQSGFGRIHGADGLREFARAKSTAKRRLPSLVPLITFDHTPRSVALGVRIVKLLHGRSR
ncbi:acyl-CoA reductase-like NAD-dependent aldehyde dehydrogenase [Allocatelliglobosispora scoriae]|uniref:Aldehyde dehydrogenase n=1 Tax=Allocatelliglobosispora scoriae TaxID=643052 RepID=A0A841BSL8_9ACTN|nr:aldehyde dehydrogenase family protein [Allocatelliglobosispora scoriae]MBB5872067.1 acyl-CoA reductase-like NAD-dependent aldehyde dehydrogenase [Allocatelliglobosispora scoriae]